MKLDGIDRHIIEGLQRDGRRAYTVLAREVGISEAAVRARVRKLTDAGVIDVVAVTNPLMVGFDMMVEIVCSDNRHLLKIVQRMREVPGVKSTETFMYLDLHKQTFAWGTR